MKRFLPLMAALAVVLWLPAGASAYNIEFGSIDTSFTLSATAGDTSVGSGPITNPPLGPGQVFNAQGVATAVSSNGLSSATSDWSVIVMNPQVSYLPGGGKDTSFSTYVNLNHLALNLAPGVSGAAGISTKAIPSFLATREDGSTAPILRMDVNWGGSNFWGLNANIYLMAWTGGNPSIVWPFGGGGYYVPGSDLTDSREATSAGVTAFTSNPGVYWYLQLYLSDATGTQNGGTSGLAYDANAWVEVTFNLIEPNIADPAPVPPSLILLGSGLLTLALARRRQRG